MSDIRQVAQNYIDMGWSVVPLNPVKSVLPCDGRTRPTNRATSMTTATSPSSSVTRPMASWTSIVTTRSPLPLRKCCCLRPGASSGAGSKPSSHYLFLCPGIKTTQFTDVKASDGSTQMLVEIRSTAAYTMMPPSIHPSNDAVVWELEDDLMQRTPDEMFADARAVAIAALVAIHYPGHGARHFSIGQYLPGSLAPSQTGRRIRSDDHPHCLRTRWRYRMGRPREGHPRHHREVQSRRERRGRSQARRRPRHRCRLEDARMAAHG